MDLNRDLREQGPFAIIWHKMSDLLILAEQTHSIEAQMQMDNFNVFHENITFKFRIKVIFDNIHLGSIFLKFLL